MSYFDRLRAAADFTQKMGWTSPVNRFPPKRPPSILNKINRNSINAFAEHTLAKDGAFKCLNTTLSLHNFLWDNNIPCFYTAGHVQWMGQTHFKCSEPLIEEWKAHGIPNVHDIHIHAWCTLHSGDVIDASFLTSCASLYSNDLYKHKVVYWNEELVSDFIYYPLLLGQEWALKLGLQCS